MRCSNGRRFLASARAPEALEKHLEAAISSIKRLFCPCVTPIFSTSHHFLNALGGSRFSVQNRIYEVSRLIWHLNFPRGVHGVYHNGKIFLKEANWCRKTLYHEALHSVSVFSVRSVSSIGRRHLFFSEGLTEFFAGYMLFKDYKTCYNSWKRGTFRECKLSSYKNKVKLWCTFCNFIELSEVIRLYFWNGSGTWDQRYVRFLTAIRNAGYPDFRDVLNLGNNTDTLFVQECVNNFGRDFHDVLHSRKSLDYALIKA